MKIYDITREIREGMPVYKNRDSKRPKIELTVSHDEKGVQESKFHIESHTGTHVDAPLHMLRKGSTVLDFNPENFVTQAQVLDFTGLDKISKEDLEEKNIEKSKFILFKTDNSFDKEFNFKFVYLDETGASYLADKAILGVGIDSLGIEREQSGHPTHKILMKEGIIIIEGLDLSNVEEGEYEFIFLPLKIKADASPIRALLIER